MSHAQPSPDTFAGLLGIDVTRGEPGHAQARVTVNENHLNPHGTTHGAFLFALAGVAMAAAVNDAEHSGMVSAVHIDYLAPSRRGDELRADAGVAERLPKEDIVAVRVLRGDQVIARVSGRANRRPRDPGAPRA